MSDLNRVSTVKAPTDTLQLPQPSSHRSPQPLRRERLPLRRLVFREPLRGMGPFHMISVIFTYLASRPGRFVIVPIC